MRANGKEINMEKQPLYKRTHPMVPIACASVVVMSLVGIGVFTGVIPNHMSSSQAEPSAMVSGSGTSYYAGSAPPAPAQTGAQSTGAQSYSQPPATPAQPYYTPAQPAAPAQPMASPAPATAPSPVPVAAATDCLACGRVESVQAVQVAAKPTGVGAVAGGVGGALIGNQLGEGRSRTPLTLLGAAGGAFAGHTIEKHVRKTTVYRVQVRMDDGTQRSFPANGPNAYASGERVRVENGTLVRAG
jgi:outer membrane lipoprotein SlyB